VANPIVTGPSPWRDPAVIVTTSIAALAIVTSVSFRLFETDFWQHLVVGKVIWQIHAVPATHLWTWPSLGKPEVLPSWLFCALVWPFWVVGGVWGLFVWRWLTTLVAFGLLWTVARRLGTRGLLSLVVLVVCSLAYRQRSQIRPETLVAVLLALQLWILETRRQGGRNHARWLVVIGCVWINVHLSYWVGLMVAGIFWLEDLLRRAPARRKGAEPARDRMELGILLLATGAVSLLNPSGWRGVATPFEYFFVWRHEPIYQRISELQAIRWDLHVRDGLPLLMAGWPLLVLWRPRSERFDRVEALLCAAFTALALFGQRFIGFYVLVAAPYLARDLDRWLARVRAGAALPTWARAAGTAVACVAVGLPEWSSRQWPLGVGLSPRWYPEAACDFMRDNQVEGRGFNSFAFGGYMLFRFWPDRSRLPFIDVHQSGTVRDRYAYAMANDDPRAWHELDHRYRFDYALVLHRGIGRLVDFLDADTSFALVFVDDVAALYARRQGPMAPVASRFAYRMLPAGAARLPQLEATTRADSTAFKQLWAEVGRAASRSTQNSLANNLLANMALARGRRAEAREHLGRALAVNGDLPQAHQRLGVIAFDEDRPLDALREFQSERGRAGPQPGLDLWIAKAHRRSGNARAAERWYRRALEQDPGSAEAIDSLAAIERGS